MQTPMSQDMGCMDSGQPGLASAQGNRGAVGAWEKRTPQYSSRFRDTLTREPSPSNCLSNGWSKAPSPSRLGVGIYGHGLK